MNRLIVLLMAAICCVTASAQTLAERLGYQKTDRILIINNDDAGMCHAANMATIEGMEKGLISSATIMMPCPWSNEMIAYAVGHPEKNFGVHLTLTAEWKKYRWATVAPRNEVPGLYDNEGYMWHSVEEVYQSSSPEEALAEGRAQIKKALDSGIRITHLDSHMGTYQYSPEYMAVYIQLAKEFNLPLRMPSRATFEAMGFPALRDECERLGIVCTDHFIHEELKGYTAANVEQFWTDYIKNLRPGVTEIYIHASKESDEIRAITASADKRIKELAFFTSEALKALIEREGINVISYRPLMELQRKEAK